MRRSAFLIAIATVAPVGALAAQQRVLTAADYARAEKFLGFNTQPLVSNTGVQPTWLPDGRFTYRVRQPDGAQPTFVVSAKGVKTNCTATGASCPAAEAPRPAPRNRTRAPEVLSPDGSKAAFIREWNLWVRDVASNQETQVTADGVKDFGYATDNAGWVHSDRAVLLWSPDSRKIATFQQDQRNVGDMYLVRTKVGHPELLAWKYPLPGDSVVSMIHRVVVDLSGTAPRVVRFKMPADQHRSSVCDHIACGGKLADVEWFPDGSQVAFLSNSRDHKVATLRVADAATGDVRDVLREEVKTQFESGDGDQNWRVLPASNEVIWFSERDDWGQLYLYDLSTGALKNQITTGEGTVLSVERIDAKTRMVWFVAAGKEAGRDPYFRHLYRVGLNGKGLTLLTPEDGDHNTSLSPDGARFVDSWSRPDLPQTAVLRDARTGALVTTLEKGDISKLVATGWKPPTRITVKDRDGKWDLYGLMWTPTQLDSTRKYPIINYIYPGPQGGSVGSRQFTPSTRDNQALAELGFIVVAIDGTGNPTRSKSFHDAYYARMGDNTLPDQIAGMKQLAARHAFIDLDRVGIWGHSGGGFATAGAMFRYPDFFKVGISESGNHDNRNYEDDWGERYHGLLVKTGATDSYDAEANQVFAKNLKGKLLLAHGTLDDNVPPDNTYLVVDALIKAGKDFDLLMIPNAAHGYGPASNYMMRRRWDYFVQHLLGATPPREYQIGPK
ncbi:S9 family peptidase [Gemmatimonas phototrophica]|uniref:Peptidase S9 n=1 Tax=Gemmatimonas phototrophica TaxID=1379270 RepID=A0A143BM34_9BACT|nr:S9 family peptidase [Gemmatimonas phototrophica]AMW05582.1 peptidase S9 [Gemmatimonas phototrophica]